MAPAEQMKVNVKDRLSGVGAAVDDEAVTVLGDALLLGETVGDAVNSADELADVVLQIREQPDVHDRHDENVDRRLRSDIPKGDDAVVAVDDIAFDLALDNAAKKTIRHRSLLIQSSSASGHSA